MRTLTLDEAAEFLKIPNDDLIQRIESDNLPAAKIGEQFLFLDTDLANYLRSHYRQIDATVGIFPRSEFNPIQAPKSIPLFREMVPHVMRLEDSRVRRGDLSTKALRITRYRLEKWVLPVFGDLPIDKIDYLALENFVAQLGDEELQGVAISQYLVIVRKVLNYAQLTNLITSVPTFPRVKVPRTSRGAFTISEYRQL